MICRACREQRHDSAGAAPGATVSTAPRADPAGNRPGRRLIRRVRGAVRRLLPGPVEEVDPYEAYGDTPADWLRIGMVMSLDGSVTDEDGWTDRLGSPADLQVFRTLRALADGIMVGAATVRTGRMGPHRPTPHLRERRRAGGKPPTAPIIVVSQSLRLDWSHRLFTEAPPPPSWSPAPRGTRTPRRSGASGRRRRRPVDLVAAVPVAQRVRATPPVCRRGPDSGHRTGQAGLVDEFCLTLAPTLLGARTTPPPWATCRPPGASSSPLCTKRDGTPLLTRYRRAG